MSFFLDMSEREFSATVDQLSDVTSFVEEELDKLGCPMRTVMQIDVALEEIFVNIAHYAYGSETGTVTLAVSGNPNRSVSIQFRDHGVPFNPLAKQDPDIKLDAQERNIGGLGIFMVKKTMDSVEYRYEDNQNIFTMTKGY